MTLILESIVELQHRITDSTETLLCMVADIPDIREFQIDKSRILLETLVDTNPLYSNAYLVDLKGNVIAAGSYNDTAGKRNFSDTKQFINSLAIGGFSSGEYPLGKTSEDLVFPFARAVINQDGALSGAVIIEVNLSYYLEMFQGDVFYENSIFGLSDHRGIRLLRYPPNENAPTGIPIKPDVYSTVIQDKEGSVVTENAEGKLSLITYASLSLNGEDSPYMYMFLGQSYDIILNRANVILARIVIISFLSLLLALSLAALTGRNIITKHIERLSETAVEFSRGDEDVSTGVDYGDGELGQLARTIDSMVETIRERNEEKSTLVKQLNRVQKMDAIGQLAGGIAHDFNNLLGGILGAADLLDLELPVDSELRAYQKIIDISATRAADLTGKLLAFSRTSGKAWEVVDMHSLINETVSILKNTIDKRIVVEISLLAKDSHVSGDPTLFQSALLNLGINASQAITENGRIEISTSNTYLDEELCRKSEYDIKPGSHIIIDVKDNGCGIPEANREKIFEPFFTTKDKSRGTGLGLSAVYGTIQRSGGSIEVCSEINRGTLFRIILPLADGPADDKPSSQELIKGTGTILIVDDEEQVRLMAQLALEKLGYKTVSLSNGYEAIEYVRGKGKQIDLVLLDMIMPELNGRDCYIELKRIAPELPILLSTGLVHDDDLQTMFDKGLHSVINKPYTIYDLSRSVNDILRS